MNALDRAREALQVMSDAVDRAPLPFTLIRRDTRAACIVYRHDRADDGIVRLREFRGPDRLKRSRAFAEEYCAAARGDGGGVVSAVDRAREALQMKYPPYDWWEVFYDLLAEHERLLADLDAYYIDTRELAEVNDGNFQLTQSLISDGNGFRVLTWEVRDHDCGCSECIASDVNAATAICKAREAKNE